MSEHQDIFEEINNAVLDLQASQLQTYQRPLKRLVALLNHAEFSDINRSLIEGVNYEDFLKKSAATQGGMVGSRNLVWPDDPKQVMGLTLKLLNSFGDDPEEITNFGHDYFYSGSKIMAGVHSVVRQLIIPFVRDYKAYVMSSGAVSLKIIKTVSDKIFIVHGHDDAARETVARFLERIGLVPIILHEQANRGRTVIEKIEANSDVGFAVVLLTPDDMGCAKGGTPEPRARQNVLLELGYFIGHLKRERVCALRRGQVEIPSDFAGVVWTEMDAGNGWKTDLAKELQAAGYTVDWNKVMR